MKKTLAVLGLCVLLVLSLSACGENNAKPETQSGDNSPADVVSQASSDTVSNEIQSQDVQSDTINQVDSEISASDKSQSIKQNTDTTVSNSGAVISNTSAKQIALNHAGVKGSQISNFKIEFDRDDGRKEWEIDFFVGSNEFEYTIDASNGNILKAEKNDKNLLASSNSTLISREKAKQIALNHAGLKEANIIGYSIELDRDSAVKKWEIEFKSGKYEYDYEINAETGKILKSQKEMDD